MGRCKSYLTDVQNERGGEGEALLDDVQKKDFFLWLPLPPLEKEGLERKQNYFEKEEENHRIIWEHEEGEIKMFADGKNALLN